MASKRKDERPSPTVRQITPTCWVAGSRSRANVFHTVLVMPQPSGLTGFTCDCEHFTLGNGAICAHIKAVEAARTEAVGGRASATQPASDAS